MSTILLTGANGFISYYLIPLLGRTHFIVGAGKGENRMQLEHQNFKYESIDFTNAEQVKNAFLKYKPQIVIHTAAISKPDECELNKENAFLTNVTGTINLLNEAQHLKSHFIYMSTDFVFDGQTGFYKEDDALDPVNYYGVTKMLAEEEVQKYEGKWSIVRTVLVYGKSFSGRENIVTSVAKSLKNREPLKIFGDQVRTPTYVEDLAKGIVAIVEKEATGVFHIAGEDVKTPYQIAVEVANFLELDQNLVTEVTADEFDQPAKRPLKTGLDISKAKRELDYNPISFTEGLKRTFNNK